MKELKADISIVRQAGLGKVVDTIIYRQAGLSTPLYWNKDDCKFGVHLANEAFRDMDANVVKKYAMDAMKAIGTLVWTPVILVMDLVEPGDYSYGHKRLHQREVNLHFDRFYAADLPDGSVRCASWEVPDEKRMSSFTNTYCWVDEKRVADLPFNEKNHRQFFFPYTEEMWVGLCALGDGIDQLRQKMRSLLRQPDVQQVIGGAGSKMLKMLADAPPVPMPETHAEE
jgi:hypothetical protein